MLAHYIEEEGVPTACISAIRMHSEAIKNARSLWVPFELGRPLGVPNDPAFQRRVLLALLRLFERSEGPILEDYPEEAPEVESDMTVLACPVYYGDQDETETEETDQLQTAFLREIKAMRPWYDMAVNKRQRTTVGISGIDLDSIGDFIYPFVKGTILESPRDDIPLANQVKLAVDDLKAYYFEGATAQPGQENVSSEALKKWFWYETVAGKVLLYLVDACEKGPDNSLRTMAMRFAPSDVYRSHKIERGESLMGSPPVPGGGPPGGGPPPEGGSPS